MNLEIDRDEFTYKNRFRHQNYVLDPNSDVEDEIFLTDLSWQF